MTMIHTLKINNFRGIKTFEECFNSKNFICLIGRGDTGKSTILDAITSVLSPSWNIVFYDSDFYNCDVKTPISIEATLIDFPKYFFKEPIGLHLRGIDNTGNITDVLSDDVTPAITIKLEVTEDLEPKWTIINSRQEEPYPISANVRAKLGVYLISDYTDSHFSWTRGNPLQMLFNQIKGDSSTNKNIILEALRSAKNQIDLTAFSGLDEVVQLVKTQANDLGIDISSIGTSIDFKDISIRENKITLHDNNVPFRLKGKGTKRLISTAIQSAVVKLGGIMLIDEVEQGLEPDRVKHLIRNLQFKENAQVFITTHSQNVIEELDASNIIRVENNEGNIRCIYCDSNTQNVIRVCPEAMYAKKVIVCEGKTELGICRAIDTNLVKTIGTNLSSLGVVYTLGEGDSFTSRANRLNMLGLPVCVFCDSDKDSHLSPSKDDLKQQSIPIFDCESQNCIEKQAITDLPWEAVIELLKYKISACDVTQVTNQINSHISSKITSVGDLVDTLENRDAIVKASLAGSTWFKRIDHGEFLGGVMIKYLDQMSDKHLHKQLSDLINWITNGLP